MSGMKIDHLLWHIWSYCHSNWCKMILPHTQAETAWISKTQVDDKVTVCVQAWVCVYRLRSPSRCGSWMGRSPWWTRGQPEWGPHMCQGLHRSLFQGKGLWTHTEKRRVRVCACFVYREQDDGEKLDDFRLTSIIYSNEWPIDTLYCCCHELLGLLLQL